MPIEHSLKDIVPEISFKISFYSHQDFYSWHLLFGDKLICKQNDLILF